jgi:two-component system LytT family response regulator
VTGFGVLIVDDEPLAREGLRNLLSREPDMHVTGECSNGAEAVRFLRSPNPPDIVLLDVQMPGMDGFRVIEEIGAERMPPVIFVTAFDEHAVRAFDVHALDYILKPIDPDRFAVALGRARMMKENPPAYGLASRLNALLEHLGAGSTYIERIMVRHPGRLTFIPVNDVHWIEAEGDYVHVHTEGKKTLVRDKIGDLEQKLNPAEFVRIHRSAIVRIARIRELQPAPTGEYAVVLHDGQRLTLSRTYRDNVFAALHVGK